MVLSTLPDNSDFRTEIDKQLRGSKHGCKYFYQALHVRGVVGIMLAAHVRSSARVCSKYQSRIPSDN